jgi:hypothetical protein
MSMHILAWDLPGFGEWLLIALIGLLFFIKRGGTGNPPASPPAIAGRRFWPFRFPLDGKRDPKDQ